VPLEHRQIEEILGPRHGSLVLHQFRPADDPDRLVAKVLESRLGHASSNVTPSMWVVMSMRLGATPIWSTAPDTMKSSSMTPASGAPKVRNAARMRGAWCGEASTQTELVSLGLVQCGKQISEVGVHHRSRPSRPPLPSPCPTSARRGDAEESTARTRGRNSRRLVRATGARCRPFARRGDS